MNPAHGARTRLWLRAAPWVTALVVFVVFVATQSPTQTGDTPAYLQQIREGQWLARHHMLPRVLGGLSIAAAGKIWQGLDPYTVLCGLNAAAGAAAAGLTQALLQRLVHPAPAFVSALGVAASSVVWRIATTFELALFPLVPLLAAALIVAHYQGRPRNPLVVVAVGVLVAVAFGCHSLSAGALPAWLVLLALEDRRVGERALALGLFTLSVVGGVFLLYEGLFQVFHDPRTPALHAIDELGAFFEPTPDQQRGVQAPWLVKRGFADALVVPSGMGHAGWWMLGGWLGFLVLGSLVRVRTLWRAHRGWVAWALTWTVGVVLVAVKVEPGNYEYYAQPIVAAFCLSALVFTGWPRVGSVIVGTFTAMVLWFNAPIVLARHSGTLDDRPKAPIDRERGAGWEQGGQQGGGQQGGGQQGGGQQGGFQGGQGGPGQGPRNGREGGEGPSGPRGPPPPGGPPVPGSLRNNEP